MKAVLITGANKGIGFETAKQLAQLGYFIYMGARDEMRGHKAVQKLNDNGINNVESVVIDVTDRNSVHQARQILEAKTGSLDILINNAGIGGELPQDLTSCDLSNLRKIFDTNFFGAIQTTQEFLPLLRKAEGASVINISSEVGSLAALSTLEDSERNRFHAYGLSKSALNAFTIMLANELRDSHITVNSVTPGHTATDLNQFKGTKTVEQGAATIVKAVTMSHPGSAKFYKDGGEARW
ncbi:neomenthol dehydrogenase [Niastella koreensis]|uniref:Short-chain dehydrogenase/reductase SDR n=2 Tax=Niastella koreensis TaxID=354356 RepID=G8THL7_NIAKG|nr:SDR family NAD(P)-dependent oxidoreductase [Niastella koreensis]AEV97445.1 short-chain dehydrogenase/reductase SDR [Niastella koreensis GR20-10]OQP43329.1 neomenthol dehydrogenase [Niastella koreensis]